MITLISRQKLIDDLIISKNPYEDCKNIIEMTTNFFTHLFSLWNGYAVSSMRVDCKLCAINDMLLQCKISSQENIEISRMETILIYELLSLEDIRK